MNLVLTVMPSVTPSPGRIEDSLKHAGKKAVLLLGYPSARKRELKDGAGKSWLDVRPPERWGINE